jgi:hypothetical protein
MQTDRLMTMKQFLEIWWDLVATGAGLYMKAWAYRTHDGQAGYTTPKKEWTGPLAIELGTNEMRLNVDDLEDLLAVCRRHGLTMLIRAGSDDGHGIGFGAFGGGRFLIAREDPA